MQPLVRCACLPCRCYLVMKVCESATPTTGTCKLLLSAEPFNLEAVVHTSLVETLLQAWKGGQAHVSS